MNIMRASVFSTEHVSFDQCEVVLCRERRSRVITRRKFVQRAIGSAAAMTFLPGRAPAADSADAVALPRLGRLKPSHSISIKASPLSIGFETLDRRLFDPRRTYEHLGKLGIKWARVQTGWCRCETEKGKYDFRWLDEIVDSLGEQGINAWFNLGYGNKLYTPEAPDVSAVGYAPVFTEEARAGWAAFVEAIACHFANRVKCWEIWNEPNCDIFWRPQKPSAAGYVELVKFTASRIRSRIPHATIVGGALAGCDLPYITECLQVGLADHVDRISFHPYSPNPEGDEAFVAAVRKQLAEKDSSVKLWQGECGCPSDPKTDRGTDEKGRRWSEQSQAKWLLRRVLTDLRQDLELSSYFNTVDLTRYNFGDSRPWPGQSYGVLRGKDHSPKPSYYAYQSLCSLFNAQTKSDPRLRAVADGSPRQLTTAGFICNGRALYAYWSATDLLDAIMPATVSLRLPVPAFARMERPVLIDPLSQRVYAVQGVATGTGEVALADLRLLDYPLIIADRAVVPMVSS
jgi:polysaccharide biosynthesis protein PslG